MQRQNHNRGRHTKCLQVNLVYTKHVLSFCCSIYFTSSAYTRAYTDLHTWSQYRQTNIHLCHLLSTIVLLMCSLWCSGWTPTLSYTTSDNILLRSQAYVAEGLMGKFEWAYEDVKDLDEETAKAALRTCEEEEVSERLSVHTQPCWLLHT